MKSREYMKLNISQIPEEIIDQYNINDIVYPEGYIYIEVWKVIPGLKQDGRIENYRLTSHLSNFGYLPTRLMPGLWKHKSLPITFYLVMDDFRVKYVGENIPIAY